MTDTTQTPGPAAFAPGWGADFAEVKRLAQRIDRLSRGP